jgi:hypothetical protein
LGVFAFDALTRSFQLLLQLASVAAAAAALPSKPRTAVDLCFSLSHPSLDFFVFFVFFFSLLQVLLECPAGPVDFAMSPGTQEATVSLVNTESRARLGLAGANATCNGLDCRVV